MKLRVSFSAIYPFDLPLLPPPDTFRDEATMNLLLRARTELGELKGYSSAVPNPLLLLSPAVLHESVESSRIENINTTVERVLQMQLFPEDAQRQPEKEVLQYREALLWGFQQLQKLPLSTRIVLGVHRRLLPESAEGYRKTQNRIQDTSTGKVLYTPPPAQRIAELMGNWEKFLHRDDGIDPLVKCAIAHYQFEGIHPFIDGNGRTGRILMVLYFVEQEFLSLPIIYLSGYINKHRGEYYRLLNRVSSHRQWHEFILFMLQGFHVQAKKTKEILLTAMKLYQSVRQEIRKNLPKVYSADLVETLFTYPILSPVNFAKILGIHYTTASRYLAQLAKARILDESFVGKYHFFVNKKLLALLKE